MNARVTVALGLIALGLTACATQPAPGMGADDLPGFWLGLVHGLIAPFALVGHLFDPSIRVYAFPNSGGWYDFGFILGIGALLGGGASQT
jgi:hypothetical protein